MDKQKLVTIAVSTLMIGGSMTSCDRKSSISIDSSSIIPPSSQIQELVLSSISVIKTPDRTIYEIGDSFSAEGGKVLIKYSNGDTKTIDLTLDICSNTDLSSGGEKTILVTYKEGSITLSTFFKVIVKEVEYKHINAINYENKMISIDFSLTESMTFDMWNIDPNLDPVEGWKLLNDTYAKALTGNEKEKIEAARIIGNDIFIGFYYKDINDNRIWLSKSKNGNPLIKHKGWSGWICSSEEDYWLPNGPDQTYINSTIESNTTYYTSVSEQSAFTGWLDEAKSTGKIFIDFGISQNNTISVTTLTIPLK